MKEQHLIKMPSIPAFKNIIMDITHQARFIGVDDNEEPIYNPNVNLPTIKFVGSVKLHGTNASICYNGTDMWAQSKGNIITTEKDNLGFANFVDKHKDYLLPRMKEAFEAFPVEEICIYGEWAGKGTQKGVAVAEIEKTFFMFGIKFLAVGEEEYRWAQIPYAVLDRIKDKERNIRNIFEFPTFTIDIDFDNPKMAQNKLLEMTQAVEDECPVGKAYGIEGVGEGIVWVGWWDDTKHNFKVKGDKHANSKVKTLSPVDEVHEQKKIDFANYACPAWRLEQAVQETCNTLNGGIPTIQDMGKVIKWVVSDILKEETITLHEYNLEIRDVSKHISNISRRWYQNHLNELVGL